MRVVHVVPSIKDEASGPSYSVVRLCDSLIGAGADVQLSALDSAEMSVGPAYLKAFPLGFGPRRLGVSPRMRDWLEAQATSGRVDLIHNHSLWMMPNVYPGAACRKGRCPLVVSPRGTLSQWALRRSALRKTLFWRILQLPVLRTTACFHATADAEYEDIRRLNFHQPVCILPNGVDVPPAHVDGTNRRRQLLFLGRIHPVKGIDVLLRAWQAVEGRFPDWDLKVAGPDNRGYLATIRTLASQLRLERVTFPGALFGEEKLHAYQEADLFVLPTHSENFAMTVAEALAAGTPAIVTKGAPWGDLPVHGAGWWIDIGVDPLVACLQQALAMPPSNLAEMGQSGRAWMVRDHSWQHIGERLSAVYRWMLHGGATPSCVRVN